MAQEIELKLTLEEDDLARVPATPPFTKVDFNALPPKKLRATYFDTPASDLRRNGIVLRLRDENGRLVQTLKSKKHFGSLAAGRAEYEFTVRKNRKKPDIKRLPEQIREDVQNLLKGKKLEPVFCTDVDRTIGLMRTEEGDLVELALDRGVIQAGTLTAPICELELELKKGNPAALYRLGLEFVNTVPARIGSRSKSERGFALANGLKPMAVAVEKVALEKQATVEEALEQVLRHCLSHIVANEPALVKLKDAEALHQMRVALRRLRAALEIFAPVLDVAMSKDLASKAQGLALVLGTARDLDVFRSELIAPVDAAQNKDVEALDKVAATAQASAWQAVLQAVQSSEFTRTCLSLALYIEEQSWSPAARGDGAKEMRLSLPARQFAAAALDKRLKKAKSLARNLDALSLAERHELRKQLKKLRYTMGFFQSLYPDRVVAKQIKSLARLQHIFGALNDLAVAEQTVADLAFSADEGDAAVPAAMGAGRVLGWHGATAEAHWSEATNLWKAFKKTPPFWR